MKLPRGPIGNDLFHTAEVGSAIGDILEAGAVIVGLLATSCRHVTGNPKVGASNECLKCLPTIALGIYRNEETE